MDNVLEEVSKAPLLVLRRRSVCRRINSAARRRKESDMGIILISMVGLFVTDLFFSRSTILTLGALGGLLIGVVEPENSADSLAPSMEIEPKVCVSFA